MTFSKDAATSRTGSGPANLAAIKDADYLYVPEGRRDHTSPAGPSTSTASMRQKWDIHVTRRRPLPLSFRGYVLL